MKILIAACIAIPLSLGVPSAIASDNASESERALLIKAASELEYIKSLLAKAEQARNKKSRIRADYANIDADLTEIQTAIERHANTPKRSPRRVNPLKKHYTR
ncbi:RAQPRD family integrative conjugative element protein [Marinagarivorans cellulosilyticus]|uniref:Uncharacterized protein n=1 Tax=Marinagarivorans cellulosilyticus TaxID=2721545 RepID=A0AAN1WHL5_9GAMM|nr:RAQPRD family integrative conjugative element protein [Marinagarivorans cellulosilyticus]BCD97763.1 hypothetical protein MARGE09_P1964 [Marinagarivorans cellulosilyticus]